MSPDVVLHPEFSTDPGGGGSSRTEMSGLLSSWLNFWSPKVEGVEDIGSMPSQGTAKIHSYKPTCRVQCFLFPAKTADRQTWLALNR